jgi:1-acyl-sn-glycerol-3-phosphate acyltransferase
MKFLLKILQLVFKVYVVASFVLSMALLYPLFKYLLARRKFKTVFKLKKYWGVVLRAVCFMRLSVKYEGNFPKAPYVVVANHSSYLDIVFMYAVVPHFFVFMGKYELLKWPLVRIFFYEMNIAVNRGNSKEAHNALVRAADAIEKGSSLALFPEGTIPLNTPNLGRFKNGAFKLAIEKQVPIVPMTFKNNWRLLGDLVSGNHRARPGTAHVVVHQPIETAGMDEKDLVLLRNRVFDIINHSLNKS